MPHTYACCFWKTKTQVISRSFLFYLEVPIIITTRQNNNNSFIDEWINFFSIQFNLKPIIMIKREDENKTKKREPENRIPHWMNEWMNLKGEKKWKMCRDTAFLEVKSENRFSFCQAKMKNEMRNGFSLKWMRAAFFFFLFVCLSVCWPINPFRYICGNRKTSSLKQF